MITTTEKLTYAAAQTARVAFYGAHYLAARVVARDAFSGIEPTQHRFPSMRATLKGMYSLFARDLANVEAGLYPLPLDFVQEVRRARASLRYLADIPRVAARRRRHGYNEVAPFGDGLPRYFRQNFHFQTGGYLSDDSARIYEFQVEALFAGTADAMRRRAFVPLAKFLRARDPARTYLLDVGAGTGGFLSFVRRVQPQLRIVALDLSEPYLQRARRALATQRGVRFLAAPAEAMPLGDATVHAAVSIYLFHELPPRIRARVAREIARVLVPGGLFVLADTIQYRDLPDCDGLIETFPGLLHEPYYESYARTDLGSLFGAAGLKMRESEIAYLTKICEFEKPGASRAKTSRKVAR